MNKKTKKKPDRSFWENRYPLVFFLFAYFTFSLLTYRDFGVSWDEYTHYSKGAALCQFWADPTAHGQDFLAQKPGLDFFTDEDFLYTAVLSFLNPAFSMEYFHWLNMAFASLAFIAVFEMLLAQVGRPWLALAGPVFLALSPQFLGQIPMNPRDAPFAVVYLLSLACIASAYLKARPSLRVLVLGLLFGLAISLRIVGFSLFFVFVLFEIYESMNFTGAVLQWNRLRNGGGLFTSLILISVVSGFVLAVSWPYLGADFFTRLKDSFFLNAHFPYEVHFIFMGKPVSSLQLPWVYLPVWLLITTPIFIILFFSSSAFLIRRPLENRTFVLLTIAFVINLGLVLSLRPVVYLGMRHYLYFVPILSALAALSAVEFYARFSLKKIGVLVLGGLVLLNGLWVLAEEIRLHPYEYIYFNELVGGVRGAYGKFEIEYMATSTKEAVEWIQSQPGLNPGKPRRIFTSQEPFQVMDYLNPATRLAKGLPDADYALVLPAEGKHWMKNKLVYSVSREGVPLMDIYQK